MTIDEAIERERRKAKEQRKDNGNCEYKAEYGCKGCADYYSNSCIECAEEYNGGWIACSEKLPELRQDVLVTVKYTGFMGMHGRWIKTGHMEAENDWWGDCAGGEVIAWMKLPAAYKESED